MSRDKRKRYWIDGRIQGMLVRRFLYYWVMAWAAIVGLTFLGAASYSFSSLTYGESSFSDVLLTAFGKLWLPIGFSIIALPVVLRDYIRLSHRFCGPMVQFRRVVNEMTQDKEVRPIDLRKSDYWQDFAKDLNEMIAKHNQNLDTNVEEETHSQVEEAVRV